MKRGGLSSGGKVRLEGGTYVNFPFYEKRETPLFVSADRERENGVLIGERGKPVSRAVALLAPAWYGEKVGGIEITKIFTAHNRQLAASVYEDCSLFFRGEQCRFCVINASLGQKSPELVRKKGELFAAALEKIPREAYGGITLNGGMTFGPGRGMELIEPAVRAIRLAYPNVQIAVEITPPEDLGWVDRMSDAGASSLMMNLETWDRIRRSEVIPGKDKYCPREQYLAAFERGLKVFGQGKVSTCFVLGTEPVESLKEGIEAVARMGVVPSPLAGRYFEDIPDYPFAPNVDWRDFLEVLGFAAKKLREFGVRTTDRAGCVACGMCDLIKDMVP